MSQHDLTIDNQGFPAFRADLNNALQALGSTQSGTTAPSPTFANQLWYDTTNNILKIRNEDNDAWISLLTLDQSADSVSQISTALAVLSAGTLSAPSITTTGDTNTGIFFPAADTIAFTEGGVESMRIDSSGNLGLGTASPNGKLDVTSTSAGANTNTLFLNNLSSNASTATSLVFGVSTAPTIRNATIQAINAGSNAINLAFLTSDGDVPAERMRITSAGNVLVGITSARANAGDVQVSKGISFPATQSAQSDANTLDDYEEGTWTPALVAIGGAFSSNPTYSTQTGTYTKIGRFVYCNFRISLSNKGTTTVPSYVGIGGFPFTVGAAVLGTGNLCFGSLGANWITLLLQPNASDTNAYLIGIKAAGTDTVYTSILANNFPDLTNTTLLSGNFVYEV